MNTKNRVWIRKHRKELEEKYQDKVLIVCENKVVRVLDSNIGILDINDIAKRICEGKDWSYTFACRDEECVL